MIRLRMHLTTLAAMAVPNGCAEAYAPMAWTPYFHETYKLSSIKDSSRVRFLSFFLLPCSDEKIEPSKSVKENVPRNVKKNEL